MVLMLGLASAGPFLFGAMTMIDPFKAGLLGSDLQAEVEKTLQFLRDRDAMAVTG